MLHTPVRDKDIRVEFGLNTHYGMTTPTYQGTHYTTRPAVYSCRSDRMLGIRII